MFAAKLTSKTKQCFYEMPIYCNNYCLINKYYAKNAGNVSAIALIQTLKTNSELARYMVRKSDSNSIARCSIL